MEDQTIGIKSKLFLVLAQFDLLVFEIYLGPRN